MNITELILLLHQEMLSRGNVKVYLGGPKPGRQPVVLWADAFDNYPEGIYIN